MASPAKHGPVKKVQPNVPVVPEPVKPAPQPKEAPETDPEPSPGILPPSRPSEANPGSERQIG
jgi:hypothetical protein